MKLYQSYDHDLKYKVIGDGDHGLVLIHGFGGAQSDWNRLIPELSQDFKILSIGVNRFFSASVPITFKDQVQMLNKMLNYVFDEEEMPRSWSLCGESYGSMLSMGLYLSDMKGLKKCYFINPVPFSPLEKIRSKNLNTILRISSLPGGAKKILNSSAALEALKAIGDVFQVGLTNPGHIKVFNQRKILLIEHAIERFMWIHRHENWKYWSDLLNDRNCEVDHHVLFCSEDELFDQEDYLTYARRLNASTKVSIPFKGHKLVKNKAKVIAGYLLKNK